MSRAAAATACSSKEFLAQLEKQLEKLAAYYSADLARTLAADSIPQAIVAQIERDGRSRIAIRRLLEWFSQDFPKPAEVCAVRKHQPPVAKKARQQVKKPTVFQSRREGTTTFALIARSLGFKTRFIYAHQVGEWLEVFVDDDGWIHVDPMEEIIDDLMFYEVTLQQPLTYVIAVERDAVADVTVKYARFPALTLKRRTAISEEELTDWLATLSRRLLQRSIGTAAGRKARQEEITADRGCELVRCLRMERPAVEENEEEEEEEESDGEELESPAVYSAPAASKEGYVIKLKKESVEAGIFIVRYDVVDDRYVIGGEVHSGFASCVSHSVNMMRKREHDWQRVYLCRDEANADVTYATAEWAFDMSGVEVRSISVLLRGLLEKEGGRVTVVASAGRHWQATVPVGTTLTITHSDVCQFTSHIFRLRAVFSGGTGFDAFQHAQLFRDSVRFDRMKGPHMAVTFLVDDD